MSQNETMTSEEEEMMTGPFGIPWLAIYCFITVNVTLLVYFLVKKLFGCLTKPRPPTLKKDYKPDLVYLHTPGKSKYTPSLSTFVFKLETYLRCSKTPYQIIPGRQASSKGKIPWIEYNGREYEDSQFIMEFLNHVRAGGQNNLDHKLTQEQLAVSRAMVKMAESDLYWILVSWRVVDRKGKDISDMTGGAIPTIAVKLLLLDNVTKATHAQGIGRHSLEQRVHIAKQDLQAISDYKGSNKFLFGDEVSEADCSIFSLLAALLWGSPGSPYEKMLKHDFPSLCDYCDQMKMEFWPDWEEVILH